MTEPTPSHRQNCLDLVRFVLAGMVVFSHSFEMLGHPEPLVQLLGSEITTGWIALVGFFAISGHLIVASWDRSRDLGSYLKKRCARIYPGFLASFLISALIVGSIGGGPEYFREFAWPRAIVAMFTLGQPSTPPVFAGQLYPRVNGALWSIRYEFACYLIVATLGVMGLLRRRRWLVGLTLMAALVPFVVDLEPRLQGAIGWPRIVREVVRSPLTFTPFLVGACCRRFGVRPTARGCTLAGLALAASLPMGGPAIKLALATAGGYLLLALGSTRPKVAESWDRMPDVSYGLYLYGWPIQALLINAFPSIEPLTLFGAALVLGSLAGAASWFGVERWFLRSGRQNPIRPESTTVRVPARSPALLPAAGG